MVQNLRDFHQLGQIDALSLEHLVNIGFLTVYFVCKPIDSATLTVKLILNQLANMYFLHGKIRSHSYAFLQLWRKSTARVK